jgi:CRP-like cAMP-binding protein
MKQGDAGIDLYFIMQGDCTVNLTDFSGNELVAMSLLVDGDHFGEISCFYKCPVTCTVVSRNYNTLARLHHDRFKMVFREYPQIKK